MDQRTLYAQLSVLLLQKLLLVTLFLSIIADLKPVLFLQDVFSGQGFQFLQRLFIPLLRLLHPLLQFPLLRADSAGDNLITNFRLPGLLL